MEGTGWACLVEGGVSGRRLQGSRGMEGVASL